MKYWVILFVLLFLPALGHAERVRKVKMKRDQIVQVRTAIGVATKSSSRSGVGMAAFGGGSTAMRVQC